MPAIFEYTHTITDDEIDGQGHVNNLAYIQWLLKAAVAHSKEQGWAWQRYREMGAGWVVRSHWIEYLKPSFANEEVRVLTWVSNFKKITSLRKYKIIRPADGTTLAVAETNWAFIGLEHRVPRRVPDEFRESFILVPEDEEP